ncbi:hypothetical protein NQ314_017637 [Rhamnusium bicolor]|uniref:Methylated-DNA--protein-cysteine methyltransferase n=1 Tax=Rhamnusium bicolor TaxID=1586634 RepID=A0AAV8WSU9_9CUCU|nr:hypothetical protein NQ314_017637 [Rhamnusium bicolor]
MSPKCLISKIKPKEYKKMVNFNITYGTADTRFGKCFMGLNEDNVCFLSFLEGSYPGLDDLKKTFPKAALTQDDGLVSEKTQNMFDDCSNDNVKLLLKGTDFETKVWEELLNLQKGSTSSYEEIAKAIGNPKAIRAVANAIAKNNISYLVPCHRVISKKGTLNKYRWGVERKLQMLQHENAM